LPNLSTHYSKKFWIKDATVRKKALSNGKKSKVMKWSMFVLISASIIAGCGKTVENRKILNGKYRGTFQRTQGIGNKEIANVSITFSGNTYSGTSDKPRYPAICNGTYTTNDKQINFTNGCAWTADFDWTLILNNEYSLQMKGDSVEIKREYAGQMTDIYKLKKE
jgi:hypothetical protein